MNDENRQVLTPVLSDLVPDEQRIKTSLDKAEAVLQQALNDGARIATDLEWKELHLALSMNEMPSSPYSVLSLIMTPLQAVGVVTLWLSLKFSEFRSVETIVFSLAVVFCSTYALSLNFRMNGFYRNLNSYQLASMIKEMRRASAPPSATN